jgi:serine/threonine protein kinase
VGQVEDRSRVPGFILFESRGRGGFGEVFRGEDVSPFKTPVALKIITPHPFLTDADPGGRFLREADAVRRLTHKGIVRYVSSGWTNDQPSLPFLAMDFIEGVGLQDWAMQKAFVERIGAVVEILDAIEYAHSKGVLHRDVKPNNVIVRGSDGQPILVDFGLAYVFEGQSSADLTSRYVGSLGYIPEEVLANPHLRTPLHDVYSCGVVAYQLCACQLPTPRTYKPLASVDGSLSALDMLIMKALAPAPQRFQSAKAFAHELRAWRERSLIRSRAGANPHAEQLRANLIQKRNAADERERQLEERQAELNAQWSEAHDIVMAGADLAFDDVHAALADELPGSSVSKTRLESDFRKGRTLTELIRFDNGKGVRVVLALCAEQMGGVPSMGRSMLIPQANVSHPRLRQPMQYVLPYWVIYGEWGSPNVTRTPHGAIALTPTKEMIVKPLLVWSGNMGTSHRSAKVVRSVQDVRDYVTKAIGAALGLDHG